MGPVSHNQFQRLTIHATRGVQVAAAHHLQEVTRKEVEGRAKLGITAFAEALLGIPKILAENSGYDAQVCGLRVAP